MPKFSYYAKTKAGEAKKGIINAISEDVAVNTLQSHGLTVVSIKDEEKKNPFASDLELFNGVSAREMVVFSRLLATLLEVQVPLIESISILQGQTNNKYFQKVLAQVVADVQDGSLLSEAMSKHPKVFTTLYVAMVQSGEVSGSLQEALLFMAQYLEDQYDLNNKVKGALMYPGFVLAVFTVIGFGVAYFVLPQLISVLEGFAEDTQLPLTTRIIISASNFLQENVFIILGLILVLVLSLVYYFRTPAGKKFTDKWQLKVPLFGDLFTKIYVARFATNMRTLLQGGIPILTSLKISSTVVGNSVFAGIIQDAIKEIKEGGQMSAALLRHKEFPDIAGQMVKIGEKSGKIDSVLETLARFYKKEVDVVVDNLTTLIEPVMIVILGLGVGVFVVSILMPIYNVAGSF